MKKSVNNNISAELLAAYLDGNATEQESQMVLDALAEDAELRELMRISQCVDAELGMVCEEMELLPMTAMAATCEESNYCCLECEKFILSQRGMEYDADHESYLFDLDAYNIPDDIETIKSWGSKAPDRVIEVYVDTLSVEEAKKIGRNDLAEISKGHFVKKTIRNRDHVLFFCIV